MHRLICTYVVCIISLCNEVPVLEGTYSISLENVGGGRGAGGLIGAGVLKGLGINILCHSQQFVVFKTELL